ncbi:Leucine rich repeat protein [Spraguea lophii 42_110]|uniref:Leucine rich repeat protein n=1 Tax=Spraguea lophii (strain 42_110) TaxID=1358809 RepID=S7WAY1_SPRLO|nr:Leucine rich repeat protein [Spraguea lophii 42_110]
MFLYFIVFLCANLEPSLLELLMDLSGNSLDYALFQTDYIDDMDFVNMDIAVDIITSSIEIKIFNETQPIPRIIYNCINLKVFKSENSFLSTLSEDFRKLSNLEHLILNNNKFYEIPTIIFSLTNLRILEMYGNRIKIIHSGIKHLTQLNILTLGNNFIVHLPFALTELTHLMHLDLSSNEKLFVPNMFSRMEDKHIHFFNIVKTLNLLHLYLNNTGLQFIPKEFNFKNITKFRANINKLSTIHVDTLKNSYLKEMLLNDNLFREFPNNILTLTMIETLSIESNRILENINIKDAKSPYLKFLNLSNNKIKSFRMCSISAPSLKILKLKNNNIKKFTIESIKVSLLEAIHLKKNNIYVLDKNFIGFKKLKFLDLRHNNIIRIDNFKVISYLGLTLKLQVYYIEKIKNLLYPQMLDEIIVSCTRKPIHENSLNLFKNYNKEMKLKIFMLNSCHLSKIPNGIEKLTYVENLSFKKNNIRRIGNRFKDMYYLKTLDLSYNKIYVIDPSILLLKSLEDLNLQNNYLKTFPISINEFNYKKLKINWIGNIIQRLGNGIGIGWIQIPLKYSSQVGIGYTEDGHYTDIAISLYNKNFKKDLYRWDIKKVAQIISNEPNEEYLSYNEIKGLWDLYLKPHITTEILKDSIETYINALYMLDDITVSYITYFTSKQCDIMKIYLSAIFTILKEKDDFQQIENVCTAISQEIDLCYDAQYEMFHHIFISLKTRGNCDITHFIKEIIYIIKYDILSHILTSNNFSQNVHKLAYWRNELSGEIGFIKNECKYHYMRNNSLDDNVEYIIYQFFILFKAENAIAEIFDRINKNGKFICLASQFIIQHEFDEVKLNEYMIFNDIDLIDVENITKKGVIFIIKKMEIIQKNIVNS